jgi:hypothetical protein
MQVILRAGGAPFTGRLPLRQLTKLSGRRQQGAGTHR